MKFKIVTRIFLTIVPFLIFTGTSNAQDPHRFNEEIAAFNKLRVDKNEKVTVFTGSSSIRFWKDLSDDCSGSQVLNTGFGGSEMTDLLFFIDEAVLRFEPSTVFIYEGDNDIANGKKAKPILKTAKKIVRKILKNNPETKIYFISAKPSPLRWNYKEQYIVFNSKLKAFTKKYKELYFIDVWKPMLNKAGKPEPSIFISDSLHMNRKGYVLWKDRVCGDF